MKSSHMKSDKVLVAVILLENIIEKKEEINNFCLIVIEWINEWMKGHKDGIH